MTPELVARLRAHVEALAGGIGPRCYREPQALERAADYVRAQLAAAGLNPEIQPFGAPESRFANVAVEPRGGGDVARVVVGAHYDTVCESPGADDNAAGVAVLIELARLSAPGPAGEHTRFIAFTNEETRNEERGSRIAARASRAAVEPLEGMIAHEMVGYYRDDPGTQRAPAGVDVLSSERGDFLAAVANPDSREFLESALAPFQAAAVLRVRSVVAPSVTVSAIGRSDHANYWAAGYPAFMLTDTAEYRNPNYHQPGDTAETLDYRRMGEVVVGLAAALESLARQP